MGVDYYNCDNCGEIFDDCGHLYNCCEECETRICFDCQVDLGMRTEAKYFSKGAKPLGDYWEDTTLIKYPYCNGSIITDDEVLTYLLTKLKKSKDEIIAEIKSTK